MSTSLFLAGNIWRAKRGIEEKAYSTHEISAKGIAKMTEISAERVTVVKDMYKIEKEKHFLDIMSSADADASMPKEYVHMLQ